MAIGFIQLPTYVNTEISRSDIEEGVPEDCECCPLAVSSYVTFAAILGREFRINVDRDTVVLCSANGQVEYASYDHDAYSFVRDFDNDVAVKSRSVGLELRYINKDYCTGVPFYKTQPGWDEHGGGDELPDLVDRT